MKQEGRQYGLVRTSLGNPTPNSRYVNKLNSPPTAGLFTKASPKPSNHSKFTGKCGRSKCTICHLQPTGKAKGTKKLRGYEVVTNYRLMIWRVTDTRPRLTFFGFSATSCILDHLANDHMDLDDTMMMMSDERTTTNVIYSCEITSYDMTLFTFCNKNYILCLNTLRNVPER